MAKYLLVARDSGEWTKFAEKASPAELQAVLNKYRTWSERVAAAGKLQGGQKLFDGQGRVLRSGAGVLKVSDGPYVEGKEVIGGFWILEASSYDEAQQLAADSPHLAYGSLELRAIEEM